MRADFSDPGSHPVAILEENWRDDSRSREIPVKMYYPADATDARPTILYSHGLGGTRDAGEIWGRHWASYGYISIHMQHHGSDAMAANWRSGSVKEQLSRAMLDPQSSIDRILDVKFVLDTIAKLPATHKLSGKIDMSKVGIGGHSMGAYTSLTRVGMTFAHGGDLSHPLDPRLKAALPLSAPAKIGLTSPATLFGSIRVPVMLMTGTEDDSPISSTQAADRPIPYRKMPPGDKYLLIFDGADHMIFGGHTRDFGDLAGGLLKHQPRPQDDTIVKMIKIFSLNFWDAYLLDQPSALEWLKGKAAVETLGNAGALERK